MRTRRTRPSISAAPSGSRWTQILHAIQSVLRKRRLLLHHPARLMKLLVLPMQILPEPLLSPGAIDFILQEVELDPKPAMEYFGFPFRRLEDGLRDYLR